MCGMIVRIYARHLVGINGVTYHVHYSHHFTIEYTEVESIG